MDHRPLLRSQPEAETALSRKRNGTLCSPPLARNGDSGGGQRRGRERNRKGTTARPRLPFYHYGVVGRGQGRWVECFMQALRKAVILSTPLAVSSLPGERRDPFLLLLLVLS